MSSAKRTNVDLDRVRDFEGSIVEDLGVGTGTTDPSVLDSGLGAQVVRKEKQRSVEREVGVIDHRLRLLVTEANGNELTETGVWAANDDFLARAVHAAVTKDESFELVVSVKSTWRNPA